MVVAVSYKGDAFSSTGTGKLARVDRKMDRTKYSAIFKENIFQSVKDL